MTQEKLKQFLDACFDAKRLIEKLPDLPDGMKPRQVHVLDAVNEIQKKQGFCRVSDISSYMNTTLPSITKLVQDVYKRQSRSCTQQLIRNSVPTPQSWTMQNPARVHW